MIIQQNVMSIHRDIYTFFVVLFSSQRDLEVKANTSGWLGPPHKFVGLSLMQTLRQLILKCVLISQGAPAGKGGARASREGPSVHSLGAPRILSLNPRRESSGQAPFQSLMIGVRV